MPQTSPPSSNTVAGPRAGAEIPTSPSANPGHLVPAPSKSQVSKSPTIFPSHVSQPPSNAFRHDPRRGAPSFTSEGLFRAPYFVRTLHIPGLDAPRRRLPFHPRWLPVRRRQRRWRTILRPVVSALRPGPSSPARSAPPRKPGCPAPAPRAGRLDPGPLGPAGPLPSPRPRLHPQGPSSPWGPHASWSRRLGASRLALTPPDTAPRPRPRRLAPRTGLGCGCPTPFPPHRKCPSAANFPRWLAPRPL